MKKHQIVAVVGTLALAVNILAPGLAFGQAQTVSQSVNCATGTPATEFYVPDNVTYNAAVAGVDTYTTDSAITDTTGGNVPFNNLLILLMGNNGGAAGCATDGGISVTADASDLSSGLGGQIIAKENIKMVSTKNVTGVDTTFTKGSRDFPALPNNHAGVLYSDPEVTGANDYNVSAPLSVATSNSLADSSHYTRLDLASETDNAFGALPLTVLSTCSGHGITGTNAPLAQYQTAIATATATSVRVHNDSAGNPVRPGTYTGTLTFTEGPQSCSALSGATLTSAVGLTDYSLAVTSSAGYPSIMPGGATSVIALIDGEQVNLSGTSDATHFTVATGGRAFQGTIASGHASGAQIYIVGLNYGSAVVADMVATDTTFDVSNTIGAALTAGDTLIFASGAHGTIASIATSTTSGQQTITLAAPVGAPQPAGSAITKANGSVGSTTRG